MPTLYVYEEFCCILVNYRLLLAVIGSIVKEQRFMKWMQLSETYGLECLLSMVHDRGMRFDALNTLTMQTDYDGSVN